jgi:hypothetical protein
MIDMIWLKLFVCCFVCLRLDFAFAADKPLPPKLQFDYAVSVTVDYKQREAYLKKNNENPQAYDAALKMMTGGLHAADITDIVEIGPAKYQINSTANLTSVLGAVIPNQTLYRLSYGDVTKDGLVTTSYVEKKGSAEQYQAKLDLRTKKVLFSKDRSKTGSADLNGKAEIELMQNRRTLFDDDNGVEESLNETEADGLGIRSTAKYYMQIFDTVKGVSLQRQQQIEI